MATAFQKELGTLARRPADLCALVASTFEEATRCLLESDHTLGGRVREDAAEGAACEDQACALPALHAPRAEDVEAVIATVHAAADLTRMGGLAREVAEPRRRGRRVGRRCRARGSCRGVPDHESRLHVVCPDKSEKDRAAPDARGRSATRADPALERRLLQLPC
jgi:hypothetical protein